VSITHVKKRDSHVVPFDKTKITHAIAQAVTAVGAEDPFLPEELSNVVVELLEKEFSSDDPPGIEDIQDFVERALMETGHASTARAYILYREHRRRIRESLRVRHSENAVENYSTTQSPAPHTDTPLVEQGGRDSYAPWDRSRIAKALEVEAELPAEVAEKISASVEERIMDSGIKIISTSLIRALVDNDLFARGLETTLKQQARMGIPRYDLEEILQHESKGLPRIQTTTGNDSLEEVVAGYTLRQYALECIHAGQVADAHAKGQIRLLHLESPNKLFAAALSPQSTHTSALLAHLAVLARYVLGQIRLGLSVQEALPVIKALGDGTTDDWARLLPRVRVQCPFDEQNDRAAWEKILEHLSALPAPEWLRVECISQSPTKLPLEALARARVRVHGEQANPGLLMAAEIPISTQGAQTSNPRVLLESAQEAMAQAGVVMRAACEQRSRFLWNLSQGNHAPGAALFRTPGIAIPSPDSLHSLPCAIFLRTDENIAFDIDWLAHAIERFAAQLGRPLEVFLHPHGGSACSNHAIGPILHKLDSCFAEYMDKESRLQKMKHVRRCTPIYLKELHQAEAVISHVQTARMGRINSFALELQNDNPKPPAYMIADTV